MTEPKRVWAASVRTRRSFYIDAADAHEFRRRYDDTWQTNLYAEFVPVGNGRTVQAIHCVRRA